MKESYQFVTAGDPSAQPQSQCPCHTEEPIHIIDSSAITSRQRRRGVRRWAPTLGNNPSHSAAGAMDPEDAEPPPPTVVTELLGWLIRSGHFFVLIFTDFENHLFVKRVPAPKRPTGPCCPRGTLTHPVSLRMLSR